MHATTATALSSVTRYQRRTRSTPSAYCHSRDRQHCQGPAHLALGATERTTRVRSRAYSSASLVMASSAAWRRSRWTRSGRVRGVRASGDGRALGGEPGEAGLARLLPRRAVLRRREPVGGDVLQDGGELVSAPAGPGSVRAKPVGGFGLPSYGQKRAESESLTGRTGGRRPGRAGADGLLVGDSADARQSGNGILITSTPAEIDGVAASWPLRLRNDVDGRLNRVGAALAAGRGHVFGVTEGPGHRSVLAFMPDHPEEGVGTLARVRTPEDPNGPSCAGTPRTSSAGSRPSSWQDLRTCPR